VAKPFWILDFGFWIRGARRVFNPKSKIQNLKFLLVASLLLLPTACRRDMQDQPKYKDLRGSAFFEDHRSARPAVPDTVPRGFLHAGEVFSTGKKNGQPVAELPMPLTRELLDRGRERYGIFCSPCHGLTGDGSAWSCSAASGSRRASTSTVSGRRRSATSSTSRHRLRPCPTTGAIPAADRWAIAAFVRASALAAHDARGRAVRRGEEARSPDAPAKAAPLPLGADDWKGAADEAPTDPHLEKREPK
jgi:hypothetical protein